MELDRRELSDHEPLARKDALAPFCKPATYPFMSQCCQLCDRSTMYQTRSGLSHHTSVHHGSWYSSRGDTFVPIPEVDMECKRDRVHEG